MKTSTNVKIIKLCKIKQWYFVADADSYNLLKSVKFPLTKFNQNMFPTVELACRPHKIKAKLVDFKTEVLNTFLDKIGAVWNKKSYRTCTIDASTLVFDADNKRDEVKLESTKAAIANLELCLRRFFARWCYSFTINYSELRGKCKLHVTYKFDSAKMPVISIVEDLDALPVIKFKLGFLRLTMQLGVKYLEINVEEQHGNEWKQIKSSRCLYSQVGSVLPIFNALTTLINKEPHNLELPNE